MSERKMTLPWGDGSLSLPMPDAWHLSGVLQPAPRPGVQDPAAEAARSLEDPVGSPRLRDLVREGMDVALVVDDLSRPTPVHLILPTVLAELERGGARREDVTLVTALGVHRPMTDDELSTRVGPPVLDGLRWINHDCDDAARLDSLGVTRRGTPVLVNAGVARADLVVSVGCIEPHIIASFGGGYKNLIPGVAGRETIAHNHTLNCAPSTFNMVGQPIERNPMRLDLEEAGRMLEPPVFIVNAVLNSRQKLVRLVSGDPVQAHREGVRASAGLYGVQIPALADVVITDSHPMDQDLRQGVKSLANTIRAVRRSGVHVTLIRAEEGVGVFGLADSELPLGRRALRLLSPLLLRLVPRLKIEGLGEEDRFFLYFALQAMRHAELLVYAPTIPAAVQANLPFVTFVDSVEQALSLARGRLPGPADVLVFPHGGITYPVLPEDAP
ncbi:MAG: nickel-dependent lactate racemase [Anaerolineae bacterium]